MEQEITDFLKSSSVLYIFYTMIFLSFEKSKNLFYLNKFFVNFLYNRRSYVLF